MMIHFGLENNIIATDVVVEVGGFLAQSEIRDVDSERQMNGWNMENEWRILQVPFLLRRAESVSPAVCLPLPRSRSFVPRMICCCLCGCPKGIRLPMQIRICERKWFGNFDSTV